MIVLDSCYIVSSLVDTEKDHKRAVELSKRFNEKDVIITNTILIETINLLTDKLNHNTEAITEIYESIKSTFKIIDENEEIREKAMQKLIKYDSKVGLADAITIEIMEELNIHEIYSFDDDFDNKQKVARIY
jgi:predicted nucleic acid-binding protein